MAKTDIRAKLEAIAAGTGPRPRGNAVSAAEHRAVEPFAHACHELVHRTLLGGYDAIEDEPAVHDRIPAPPEALPPLP